MRKDLNSMMIYIYESKMGVKTAPIGLGLRFRLGLGLGLGIQDH